MAINSYFYDSAEGDIRSYSASDFAKAFNIILQNGIIAPTGDLGLDIGGTNNKTIYAGKAVVEGHFIEVTGTETLSVPSGSYSGQVALRVDMTDARTATLVVKTDQTQIKTASLYELPLYNVTVANGIITAITADVRVQGGAVAKVPDNIATYFYRDDGVYLQIGTYSIALTPSQPPASVQRVWIQVD